MLGTNSNNFKNYQIQITNQWKLEIKNKINSPYLKMRRGMMKKLKIREARNY